MHLIVYRGGEPVRFIDGVRHVDRIGLHEPGLCVKHVGGTEQITIGDSVVSLRSEDGEVCRFTRGESPAERIAREREEAPGSLADRIDNAVAGYTDRIANFGQGAGGAYADERIKLVRKIVDDINATYGERKVVEIEDAPAPPPLGGVAYWAERYIDSIDAEEHANAAAECEYSQDNLRAAVRSLRLGSARERLRHLLLRVQEGGHRDATLVDQVADEITAWMPGQTPDDDAVLVPILTRLVMDHNARCNGIEPLVPGAGTGEQWAEQNRQTLDALLRVFRSYFDTAANALAPQAPQPIVQGADAGIDDACRALADLGSPSAQIEVERAGPPTPRSGDIPPGIATDERIVKARYPAATVDQRWGSEGPEDYFIDLPGHKRLHGASEEQCWREAAKAIRERDAANDIPF